MEAQPTLGPELGIVGARARGAVAGLAPTLVFVGIFAFGGSSEGSTQVAISLSLVGLIAMSAGWVAGPLAAGPRRRLLVGAIGYALAFIAATATLSLVQAAWDAIAAQGFDPFAIATAILGRALVALAGTAYLILPALGLGLAWSVAARWLMQVGRPRPTT